MCLLNKENGERAGKRERERESVYVCLLCVCEKRKKHDIIIIIVHYMYSCVVCTVHIVHCFVTRVWYMLDVVHMIREKYRNISKHMILASHSTCTYW